MLGKYEISIVLTVLLFALPVLYFILSKKALNPFSFKQLVKSFNLALIVQFILAVILFLFMGYFDNKLYAEGNGTDLTDIFMSTAMTYHRRDFLLPSFNCCVKLGFIFIQQAEGKIKILKLLNSLRISNYCQVNPLH